MVTAYELYQHPDLVLYLLLPLMVWELVWKGIGLWHASKNNRKGWFVVILIFNTIGILPIIYLLFFRSRSNRRVKELSSEQIRNLINKSRSSSRQPVKSSLRSHSVRGSVKR
jgi:hypothetical protein